MNGPIRHLRALAAHVRPPRAAGAPPAPRFDDPQASPADTPQLLLVEQVLPAGASPMLEPPKPEPEPDRPVIAIDGDVIITGTIAADGTFTIDAPPVVDDEPPAPPRRRGVPPNNCPCTAIYSECRCPVRP